MRFSIIVPIYNGAETLRESLQSVLLQKGRWQLILVDDGSLDDSWNLIKQFEKKDARIRCIHQENAGPYMARKAGIHCADGDYILFLDCDDRLNEHCLSKLDETIEKQKPDILCFTACSDKGCIGWMGERERWIDKPSFCRELLTSNRFNALWGKAFRRELFTASEKQDEAFRGLCWGEDKAMLLEPVSRAKRLYYLPDSLYDYKRNPQGLSKMASPHQIDVMLSRPLFQRLRDYADQWSVKEREIARYQLENLLNVYWRTARAARTEEERRLFRSYPWKEQYVPLKDSRRRLKRKDKLKLLLAWRLHGRSGR